MRGIYPLIVVFGGLASATAFAQSLSDQNSGWPENIQVAQAYDFQVYIDPQGREVVVDPRTNRVVEIREPLSQPYPQIEPDRNWQSQEADREYYDFAKPQDLERFHRDREAAVYGRGQRETSRDRREYPDYRNPNDAGYPQPDRGYSDYPQSEQRQAREDPNSGSVYRAPLDAPTSGQQSSIVPLPDTGSSVSTPPQILRPDMSPKREITVPGARGATEEVAKFQVLLDRVGASPGVIDGRMGDNVNKAISAYYEITGERLRTYDKEWINAELERTGGAAFIEYTITSEDAAGPYIASVPADYSEKAKLERLSYTRVTEMLAERFHMDEKYLIGLNPEANFNRPGTIVKVTNTNMKLQYEVGRIVADKGRKQLRIYDTHNRLVASYPATIGSESTPSPVGTHTVERVAMNPEYTYNPKINFKQGNNDKVLTIPPGPNGPVGSVWIALSKPTYGIHGTPDPEKIGKTYSNGCIRLTNWDAEELAKRVSKGVTVEFIL